MKKISLIFFYIFIFTGLSFAQFDDLLKKVTKGETWLPGKSITTSFNDVYPVVDWMDEFDGIAPDTVNTFKGLLPGYYVMDVQSYCLKAGTYGPTKGAGYLIAPMLGKNSDIVAKILERSVDHPNISQRNIQLLLWAIESGAKYDDLPSDLKAATLPLFKPEDIIALNIDYNFALDLLPGELTELSKYYTKMRNLITNPKTGYEEIERLAVQNGVGLNLKDDIKEDQWNYIGDNYYISTNPIGYAKTTVRLFKAAPVTTSKDDKGRISKITDGMNSIEIVYDDEPGRDVLSTEGNPDVPIWRFKKIILSAPEGTETLEDIGWMIRGDGKPVTKTEAESPESVNNPLNTPTYSEYTQRLNLINNESTLVNKILNSLKKSSQGMNNIVSDNFNAETHTFNGLRVATNPTNFKGKSNWFRKNLSLVTSWWNCAINATAGSSCQNDTDPPLPKKISVPANNGRQRLGMSLRQASN